MITNLMKLNNLLQANTRNDFIEDSEIIPKDPFQSAFGVSREIEKLLELIVQTQYMNLMHGTNRKQTSNPKARSSRNSPNLITDFLFAFLSINLDLRLVEALMGLRKVERFVESGI